MKTKISILIDNYKSILTCQQSGLDPSLLLNLMFDPEETAQLKQENWISPTDATYFTLAESAMVLSSIHNQTSRSGFQICTNPIPKSILDNLDKINYLDSLGPQWERVAAKMRSDISVSASLFEHGRTFFVEADVNPDGSEIKTIEDKLRVVRELASAGLPISYVIDTGGRGAHIGIVMQNLLESSDFGIMVKNIFSRLPQWIDRQVGQINQLERMPGTTRVKNSNTIPVRLVYAGTRICNEELLNWIEKNEIIHPVVSRYHKKKKETGFKNELAPETSEDKAWEYINKLNLESSLTAKAGKIQVSCPEALNHKSGKDNNKSAVIFTESGNVWCSACGKFVANIFREKILFGYEDVIQCSEIVPIVPVRPKKIF